MSFVLNTTGNKIDMFQYNDINEQLDIDYLQNKVDNIRNLGYNQAFNFNKSFGEQDLSDLITYLEKVISYCKNQEADADADDKVRQILKYVREILFKVFEFITVNQILDDEIILYKTKIFNYIKIN